MRLCCKRITTLAAAICASAAFACTAATGDSAKGSGKAAKNSASSPAPTSAVAVIGDKTITLQDVDAAAAGALVKVRQDEYEARKGVLDNMVNDEILGKESAARKVSKEELLKTEVTDKVSDPAQADIDS